MHWPPTVTVCRVSRFRPTRNRDSAVFLFPLLAGLEERVPGKHGIFARHEPLQQGHETQIAAEAVYGVRCEYPEREMDILPAAKFLSSLEHGSDGSENEKTGPSSDRGPIHRGKQHGGNQRWIAGGILLPRTRPLTGTEGRRA